MDDYSHLRLHDTRIARATNRARHSTPSARQRAGWRRMLNALHATATGPDTDARAEGTGAERADATPDVAAAAPSGARVERPDAVRVP